MPFPTGSEFDSQNISYESRMTDIFQAIEHWQSDSGKESVKYAYFLIEHIEHMMLLPKDDPFLFELANGIYMKVRKPFVIDPHLPHAESWWLHVIEQGYIRKGIPHLSALVHLLLIPPRKLQFIFLHYKYNSLLMLFSKRH